MTLTRFLKPACRAGLFAVAGFLALGQCAPTRAQSNFTNLHDFTGTPDGANPFSGVIQGRDGNFYGTTKSGGKFSDGFVYKITPTGTLTTIYDFTNGNIAKNANGLAQGSDGDFYGTTFDGGANGVGTVYRITPEGNLSAIHTFSATNGSGDNADGAYPTAIIQGSDESLYGTTRGGGTANQGVAYKITLASSAPTIASFAPPSGPVGTVVTITGTHLNGVTAVRFHQASAKVFSANAAGTQLTVTVPAGAATGTVTVTTPSGSVKTTTPFKVTP